MIFVTVGTDLPFDRMVKVIDRWARESGREDVFAQIGDGGWEPSYIPFVRLLQPPEFSACFKGAKLIISHAGMGTILSALQHGKPILVMPKKASLGEHRNEHQTATARRMKDIGRVNVAFDEDELRDMLGHLNNLANGRKIEEFASASLVSGIRQFIFENGDGSNENSANLLNPSFLLAKTHSSNSQGYVIVTPVRDEEATIGKTIDSVTAQTNPPREWIIVSDGSTDGTDDIVRRASLKHSWIRLLPLAPRPKRSFAAVVRNTEAGVRHLRCGDYGFLCLLDADVTFQPDYFEQLVQRFEADPALGLGGGVVIDSGLPRDRFPTNRIDVPGAVQFFRRECYEKIGGLIAIPEGGWDGVTCAMARMNGYKTHLFTDLVVDHLKPRNSSEGGVMRRKWQMGVRDQALGYHPVFELAKCLSRLKNPPMMVGALAWWIGYCMATLRRRERLVPERVVVYIRNEQWTRLRNIWDRSIMRCR